MTLSSGRYCFEPSDDGERARLIRRESLGKSFPLNLQPSVDCETDRLTLIHNFAHLSKTGTQRKPQAGRMSKGLVAAKAARNFAKSGSSDSSSGSRTESEEITPKSTIAALAMIAP